MSLPDLERAFLQAGVSGLPVTDRAGSLVGIVSRSDVVRRLAMEQSMGEWISDSYRDDADEDWPQKSADEIGRMVGERMERHRVLDIMRSEIVSAEPDEPVREVARRMLEHRVHRVPVLEDGRLVGLLSSMDLVRIVAEE